MKFLTSFTYLFSPNNSTLFILYIDIKCIETNLQKSVQHILKNKVITEETFVFLLSISHSFTIVSYSNTKPEIVFWQLYPYTEVKAIVKYIKSLLNSLFCLLLHLHFKHFDSRWCLHHFLFWWLFFQYDNYQSNTSAEVFTKLQTPEYFPCIHRIQWSVNVPFATQIVFCNSLLFWIVETLIKSWQTWFLTWQNYPVRADLSLSKETAKQWLYFVPKK